MDDRHGRIMHRRPRGGAFNGNSRLLQRGREGFVTYSNDAKAEMLGVPLDVIAAHGAVSEEVARAMAEGALKRSRASVAVSITGVAGPGGGSAEKPVGLVHFGLARTRLRHEGAGSPLRRSRETGHSDESGRGRAVASGKHPGGLRLRLPELPDIPHTQFRANIQNPHVLQKLRRIS